jgi:hypothetical protein
MFWHFSKEKSRFAGTKMCTFGGIFNLKNYAQKYYITLCQYYTARKIFHISASKTALNKILPQKH